MFGTYLDDTSYSYRSAETPSRTSSKSWSSGRVVKESITLVGPNQKEISNIFLVNNQYFRMRAMKSQAKRRARKKSKK